MHKQMRQFVKVPGTAIMETIKHKYSKWEPAKAAISISQVVQALIRLYQLK
jgi:hypothetical protein